MEKQICFMCGQPMFHLDEYKNRKLKAIAVIKASIREAYGDGEKGATLFATRLLEKLEEL